MKKLFLIFAMMLALFTAGCSSDEPMRTSGQGSIYEAEIIEPASNAPEGFIMDVTGRVSRDNTATVSVSVQTMYSKTLYNCVLNLFDSTGKIVGQRYLGTGATPSKGGTITINNGGYWGETVVFEPYALTGVPNKATFSVNSNTYSVSTILKTPAPIGGGELIPDI